jgi:hypothetical protein
MSTTPEAPQAAALEPHKKLSLLVLGDWVIDDTWVLGDQDSATSTVVGQKHYRSLHHAGVAAKRLCGAGRVAAILRIAKWEPPSATSATIHGLGVWADSDARNYLYRMFAPEEMLGGNCYRVVPDRPPTVPPDLYLHNLGDALTALVKPYKYYAGPASAATSPAAPFVSRSIVQAYQDKWFMGTTRVFRFYLREVGRLKLLSRVDWELPPQHEENGFCSWLPEWDTLKEDRNATAAVSTLTERMTDLDAVVIKDNGKGVVSTSLLRLLIQSCPHLKNIPWFIQTKRWQPPFLRYVQQEVEVRALVYQTVALHQYRRVSTWFTAKHQPSPEAIETLRTIAGQFSQHASRHLTVLLTGPLSAIALETRMGRKGNRLLFQPADNPNLVPDNVVGGATALFSTIVFGMMHGHDTVSARFLLDGALRVAQHWMAAEYERLSHPEMIHAPEELSLVLMKPDADERETERKIGLALLACDDGKARPDDLDPIGQVMDRAYDQETNDWEQALTKCGVVLGSQLQLSRSTIELPAFVCCAPTKRRNIATLKDALVKFDATGKRSVAGLLLARPGSGKTSLVHGLAAHLGVQVRSFNITNMMHTDDLLSCFDQIVTAQLENRKKTLLVFIDEINAEIAGHNVYEAFLTPLEDGYYVRRGQKRVIQPCVWLFVGTTSLRAIRKAVKGSDFVSRMSLPTMNIGEVPDDERPFLHLETVYIGASMARSEFPRLMMLSRDVLKVLASFAVDKTKSGVAARISHRDLRRFIARELRVDGLGRGSWKEENEKALLRRYPTVIDENLLALNEAHLKLGDPWIKVVV